jgi:hypothetical protein
MLILMLGGHTGLNSTHAKSCRLNLYGADRQHFPVAITSPITPSYVRLPILTPTALSIGAVAFGPSTAREENVILFVSLISKFMITKERSTISYPYKR